MEQNFDIVIPSGDSPDDIKARKQIIQDFYREWKAYNPTQKRYNISLRDNINVRYISIDETSAHASKSFLSTMAVLQLDAVLTYARRKKTVPVKAGTANQKQFMRMIIMECMLPGIGLVKMTVGVKRSNQEKVQYCITAIET